MAIEKITNVNVKKLTTGDEVRDTEVKGFYAKRWSTQTSFYYSYISPVTGKRRNKGLGIYGNLTVDQARTAAKHHANDVLTGIDPLHIKQEIKDKSKNQKKKILDWFLDHEFKALTSEKQYPKSVKTIRREFSHYLQTDMNEIKANDLNKWKLAHKCKPSTVNRYLTELRGVLTKAVAEGVLTISPMTDVPPLKEDKSPRRRFLTIEEEALLMTALDDRQTFHRHGGNNYSTYYMDQEGEFTDHIKPIIIVGIYAGLRPGEIFNLRQKDLDFDSRRLFIKGESVSANDVETSGTKTMQTRIVPMHQKVKDTLTLWLKDNPDNDLVFPSPVTGGRLDNIKKGWTALKERSGLLDITLYTLRHTFGTRLAQKRIDLETIRDLMGHKDIETTQKYLQTNDDIKDSAIDAL